MTTVIKEIVNIVYRDNSSTWNMIIVQGQNVVKVKISRKIAKELLANASWEIIEGQGSGMRWSIFQSQ